MSRAAPMESHPSDSSPWKPLLLAAAGFVLLDAYQYLPVFLHGGPGLYLFCGVTFFLVAHGWGRLTGAGGLRGYGLWPHAGWARNAALGFAVGLVLKAVGYGVEWALGGFRFEGFIAVGPALSLLGMALVGMFLSSATDDVLLRGYLFRHLSPYFSQRALILGTTAVYVLNHVLYARMTLTNCLMWTALGLGFAYTLARTGSLWLATGLHWGSNVMYRVRNGFDPQQGGILRLTELSQPAWFEWLGVGSMVLLAVAGYWLVRVAAKAQPQVPGSAPGEAALSPSA